VNLGPVVCFGPP